MKKVFLKNNPAMLWDQYLNVIKSREDKLLSLLQTPKTMDEIVDGCIVYGKPREPREFFLIGERGIMGKHVEDLLERSMIKKEDDRFFV